MTSTVQVLCPNGRRQNVKITPNTKILQILEEVCNKQGFVSTECNLVYGNKVLDVTLTIRFSGLPNHAKLELKKATVQRTESDVTVALTLESGIRITHSFSPSTSLWDILLHWEKQSEYAQRGQILPTAEGQQPVCIYMREEFVGEYCLKETTLYKLGLTKGKIVLRLIHRIVDGETLAEIKENIDKEKAKQKKAKASAASTHTIVNLNMPTSSKEAARDESSTIPSDSKTDTQAAAGGSSETSTPAEESMDTGTPSEISMKGPAQGATVTEYTMESKGSSTIERKDEGEITEMDTYDERPGIEIAGRMIRTQEDFNQMMAEMMEQERAAMAAAAAAKAKQATFAKGNSVPTQKSVPKQSIAVEPCERETVLYSLDDIHIDPSVKSEDPGDEFYEVTERDVKKMLKDLQNKCAALDGQPLMTQSLRQAQFEKKIAKYDKAVIRIQFPDRRVLQGLFKPLETVDSLYKFVKGHLENKDLKFHLYTTPPRSVLDKMNISLAEAGLVPLSVVHFGRDSASSPGSEISTAVLAEVSLPSIADSVVMKSLSLVKEKKETGKVCDEPLAGTSGTSRSADDVGAHDKPSTSESSAQKPKWFMVGKK